MFAFMNTSTTKVDSLRKELAQIELLFRQAMRVYGVGSQQAKKHDARLNQLEAELAILLA